LAEASRARRVAQLAPGDPVVAIGAGPAGLTAAYELTKRGHGNVTVLEADDTVGGISRTAQYHGFRFDIGGHRFFTKIEAVERLWHEIAYAVSSEAKRFGVWAPHSAKER
jgi:protoporphyrinogen oxidase